MAEVCTQCQVIAPIEWIPAVFCAGKTLPGTGIPYSQLIGGLCPKCYADIEARKTEASRKTALHLKLVSTLGGEKPCREFRLESFKVTPENQLGYVRAETFDAYRDNLYLWGPCGVGKTHLASAIAARNVVNGNYVCVTKPPQLLRRVRRLDPDEEQRAIDRVIRADVFVLGDLGIGNDTAYARQIFQEILDGREFAYRAGLVVTSKYSLEDLAKKLDDDTIPSRLAGMCQMVKMSEGDHRKPFKFP